MKDAAIAKACCDGGGVWSDATNQCGEADGTFVNNCPAKCTDYGKHDLRCCANPECIQVKGDGSCTLKSGTDPSLVHCPTLVAPTKKLLDFDDYDVNQDGFISADEFLALP